MTRVSIILLIVLLLGCVSSPGVRPIDRPSPPEWPEIIFIEKDDRVEITKKEAQALALYLSARDAYIDKILTILTYYEETTWSY